MEEEGASDVLTNRTLRMPRHEDRESARIHNPQTLHSKDSSLTIHHCHRVVFRTHLTRTCRVPKRHHTVLHRLENFVVGLHLQARIVLVAGEDWCHGGGIEGFTYAFESCYGDLLICGVGEPVWRDGREVGSGGRGDGNVASR